MEAWSPFLASIARRDPVLAFFQGVKVVCIIWCSVQLLVVRMPTQDAQTVARPVVEMWITRFGCPVSLHSDKGTNITSELFREHCQILDNENTSTTLFHPDGSAVIKRTDSTLEESFSKYMGGH